MKTAVRGPNAAALFGALVGALVACAACARGDRGRPRLDSAASQQGAVAAASSAGSTIQSAPLSFAADGPVTRLRIENGTVAYCDARGAWVGDLATGRRSAGTTSCQPAVEPNTACTGLGIDAEVRSPQGEASDIIDVGAKSYPLDGRVHDCAAEGKTLVVGTGSTVSLIDTARDTTIQVSKDGSDRVTIAGGWIAWIDGASVRAAQRATLKI